MKSLRNILIVIGLLVISNLTFAEKFRGVIEKQNDTPTTRATANCEPPRTSTELYINNVRTMVHTGGDMWWDLQSKAKYEVPAGSGCHALYAGSIWIGGLDSNGQLKLAAQKFRQYGIDFWPGPLITTGPERGNVEYEICRKYDKHFYVNKAMVTEFRAYNACLNDPNCDVSIEFPNYTIPTEIMDWPGNGPAGGYDPELAPYWDVNDDGEYNPADGDFPYYEYINEGITFDPDCKRPAKQKRRIFGDHTLWWVYNDRGNIHTETKGTAIGMEFKSQAFAFTTNDELNDMTFYNFNIINRSTYTLYETYFGVWTDADLGYPQDDYVGCDVLRGLGYSYNGDNNDETASGHNGYGVQPPAIGIDFFEGPYQDSDGLDNPSSWSVDEITGIKELNCDENIMNGNINGLNFGDGEIDNERWGMRRFLYFNNASGNEYTRDPSTAWDHYNYITGFWKDASPLYYGGTGHRSHQATDITTKTDFMFPGDTDKCGWGQEGKIMPAWSEYTENTTPGDRRFVQSAGPFTLTPGAVNDITLGAVYARASSGGPWESVEAVRRADDKAQLLFENCFRVLNGPDAPELKIVELDKKLIFHIVTSPNSNNYLESYIEEDKSLVCNDTAIKPCTNEYKFQGYQVFQLKNTSATASNRYDNGLARQIFQCDVKDGVSQLINYTWSDNIGANIATEEVVGEDNGISHTFIIDKDLFATDSDNALVNYKEYYYTVIAYAYNPTMKYNQSQREAFNGLKTPYLAGRNNIKRYSAIPHKNDASGVQTSSSYGDGIEITMVEGYGNGNNVIDLNQESVDKILSGYPWHVRNERVYENGKGPLKVKVIDPLNVVDDEYYLEFKDAISNNFGVIGTGSNAPLSSSNFAPISFIIYNSKGDTIKNEVPISYQNSYEQLFLDWGFSIDIFIDNCALFSNYNSYQNGFLEASIEFEDPSNTWLSFIPDDDGQNYRNWIRSGAYTAKAVLEGSTNSMYNDTKNTVVTELFYDSLKNFGTILGGTWAPYALVSSGKEGVGLGNAILKQRLHSSELISSVDIVITKDTSKWTRSCVVEMCDNEWKSKDDSGNLEEISPRVNLYSKGGAHKFALRKDASVDKKGNPDNSGTHGMGWFPGYAIDVRTGERLNIVFGEDSWLKDDNGTDMIWNPSSNWAGYPRGDQIFGGKHYIYVFGNNIKSGLNLEIPNYDSCKTIHSYLLNYETTKRTTDLENIWIGAMWASIPMVDSKYIDTTSNDPYHFINNDVKVRLRVATPYTKGVNDLQVSGAINNNYPVFKFNTKNVRTVFDSQVLKESALDLIRVVPNPYYGNSDYEQEQLDNYVKITNLPRNCEVSIYTISGTLVRRFSKDNDSPYIDWDLKNSYNISISSGVYIIHVRAFNIEAKNGDEMIELDYGEKVIKWFGVLRPVDLNNF